MSISQTIAPHLPYLRRFSRALSGSQKSGDTYVVTLLESLVADPSIFPKDTSPRISLYKVFLKVWNALDVNKFPDFDAGETEAVHGLQTLTPRPRQAFILLSIEGFEVADIAAILDIEEAEVARLIEQADAEIAEQIPASRVLIIEDEPLIATNLQGIVEALGHDVTGIAATHSQAVTMVKDETPHLILSDVQLEDGSSGIDAINQILGEIDVPVIFITGHPEMLLTGDRPEPTFLIPKPFNPETVKAVISQALFFDVRSHNGTQRKPAA